MLEKKSDIFELKLNLRKKLSIQSLPVSTLVYFLKHVYLVAKKSREMMLYLPFVDLLYTFWLPR